jgi:predicted RNase H-like HicB family nuclease
MASRDNLQFNIIFRPEPEGGFTAMVPSLPGCITYGRDLEEAKKASVDAIKGYITSIKKHKEKIFTDENSFISSVRLTPNKQKAHA